MTCISWSSDFALSLQDYLWMHIIVGILDQGDPKIDLIKYM